MEIQAKRTKVNLWNSKGKEGARRKHQQAAGLVSAPARVTDLAKRLEGKKADLEEHNRILTTPLLGFALRSTFSI